MIDEIPPYAELARVSTGHQEDAGNLDRQRTGLDKIRESRPGVLVGRFEETISGTAPLNQRPAMVQILKLLEAKKIKELRFHHVDRLSRSDNAEERGRLWELCRRAGCKLVDTSGTTYDPSAGGMTEVIFVLQSVQAAQDRKNLVEKFQQGRRVAATKGRMVGWVPYGLSYDRETRRWSLNEAEAKIYREIFAAVIAGKSSGQIARELTARQVAGPRRWSQAELKHLIAKKGAGLDLDVWEALRAKIEGGAFGMGELVKQLNLAELPVPGAYWGPERIWTLVRASAAIGEAVFQKVTIPVPAITDKATQDAAVLKLKGRNHQSQPRGHIEVLLRELMVCGVCNKRRIRVNVNEYRRPNPRYGEPGQLKSIKMSGIPVYTCPGRCLKSGPHAGTVDGTAIASMLVLLTTPGAMAKANFAVWKGAELGKEIEGIEATISAAKATVEKVKKTREAIKKAKDLEAYTSEEEYAEELKANKKTLERAESDLQAALGAKGSTRSQRASTESLAALAPLGAALRLLMDPTADLPMWRKVFRLAFAGGTLKLFRDRVEGTGALDLSAVFDATQNGAATSDLGTVLSPPWTSSDDAQVARAAKSADSLVPFQFEARLSAA